MNKIIITMICIIVVLVGIIAGVMYFTPNTKTEGKILNEEKMENERKENIAIENASNTQEANSKEEEKISPNCEVIKNIYYKGCEHTKSIYSNIEEEFVNLNKEELQKKLPDWEIEKFSKNKIVLYKAQDGECGEHYIVRNKDGQVVIYRKTEEGKEELVEKTDISTEYLPKTDKMEIENGIEVNGKQALYQLIEDYE